MPVTPVYFAPDIDTAWSANPGALTLINAMAPLQSGYYGTVGSANYLGSSNLTGSDIRAAYIFRKVNGLCRFLVFRSTNIDEYDNAATRTNRATALTATSEWQAAAWGDQIIAVCLANATQSSTGAAFTALSGAPKARHIASNLSFVMLANTDDGVTPYQDEVYWSGIQNPNNWTTSIATQCGRIRLLDAPGPITALVAFRDQFIAFKDNAIFVGNYVGPQQFIFDWKCISQKVGCVGPRAVAELDGKLYFLHTSGFYEFDGLTLRNVGIPTFQSFLSEVNYIGTNPSGTFENVGGRIGGPNPTTYGSGVLADTQVVADEIEGVVWFKNEYYSVVTLSNTYTFYQFMYAFNPRSARWGRHSITGTTGVCASVSQLGPGSVLVKASVSDTQAFKATVTARLLCIWNSDSATTLRYFGYPIATTDSTVATWTTGVFGPYDKSTFTGKVYCRHIKGSSPLVDGLDNAPGQVFAGVLSSYGDEAQNPPIVNKQMYVNSELQELQGAIDARFKSITATYTIGGKYILGGIAPEMRPTGNR